MEKFWEWYNKRNDVGDGKEPVYNRSIGSVKIQPVNLIKISELINDNESKLKKYVNSVLM